MKKLFANIIAILLFCFAAYAQQALPDEYAYKIKNEAFQNSQIEPLAFWMTDYLGDRLTSSKKWDRAESLTIQKLKDMGFNNARAEFAIDFPRGGWDNVKTYVAMTEPYYCHFFGVPKAWTGSTNGSIKGEVLLLKATTLEEVESYKGKLSGRIVLIPETSQYQMDFAPFASRYTEDELDELAIDPRPAARRFRMSAAGSAYEVQQRLRALIIEEKPAVVISGSGYFNVPRSSGMAYKSGDPEPVAELVLPVEDHGRMVRLINKNVSVSMEVEIRNEFSGNTKINNVIAEISGTDPKLKDEVVMLGAHLDSWHGGTGAADNASGCIVMMEALRIIKESGVTPRRTIRVALWAGEEQGLLGSRGYVSNNIYDTQNNKPKQGFNQFALYLNMDNGSGKYRGIYLEENDMAVPFMKKWMEALSSLGFETITMRKTGGTDHMSFDRYGLPAFQFIQDNLEYDRGYHTPMDTWERLILTDLQYNALVTAWLALSAAMDDGKIPAKPVTIAPQQGR